MTNATFLHLTDTHLSLTGAALKRDDHKLSFEGIPHPQRHEVLALLLQRIAERLKKESLALDAVIFSGDAQFRGGPGGHAQLRDLLLSSLASVNITTSNIVAVPGNHDVPQGAPPSSPERYERFIEVWRKSGCITPWLDGIDDVTPGNKTLSARDQSWVIFPVNSCNWCHVPARLPPALEDIWKKIPQSFSLGNEQKEAEIRSALDGLVTFDMPRISPLQLEALRLQVSQTPQPSRDEQVRIAVLHHHLRSPSVREELKPFADMPNLESLRTFLREQRFGFVVHGHKHEHAAFYDHIYDMNGEQSHRLLIVSGSTFEENKDQDAARLLTLTGHPNCPTLEIEPLPLVREGLLHTKRATIGKQLWTNPSLPDEPVVIQGSDFEMVYDRVKHATKSMQSTSALITHLDLPPDKISLSLPASYPAPPDLSPAERESWFSDLVNWWQMPRSHLQDRVAYVHGGRLRRFGGCFDQIERVSSILSKKASSRALAVLINPTQDFSADGDNEGALPSFCLASFRKRSSEQSHYVDVIAYYRTQEFVQWWPINVAELRCLQVYVAGKIDGVPGRITTVTPEARSRSPSPMQVSMPTIDRWLDQAPQRLYQLALVFDGKLKHSDAVIPAIAGWRRTLSEIRASAERFNPDGVPVPLEGLLILESYLEATATPNTSAFRECLKTLIQHNSQFLGRAQDHTTHAQWSSAMLTTLPRITTATESLLEKASLDG